MRNNANPVRRRTIRAKVAVSPEAMACWPLLKIIADGMRPTGDYSPATLARYRTGVRNFQRFIGFEQSAVNVTEAKFAAYEEWLKAEGYHPNTVVLNLECLAAVVRFADRSLLPSREEPERKPWADAVTHGTIEFYMQTEYFPVNLRVASEATKHHYSIAVGKFSEHLGRPATLADLTDEAVERWKAALLDSRLQTKTVNSYLTDLRAFWKFAFSRGMVANPSTITLVKDSERTLPPEPEDDGKPAVPRVKRNSPADRKAQHDLGAPNSIARFVKRYLSNREVCEVYAYNLRRISAKFARFTGTAAVDELFSEDAVNDFLRSLDLSPFTVRGYRSLLLALWTAAANEDIVPYPRLQRIRRPKVPEIVVQCYSVEEMQALLKAADRLDGEYNNGVLRRLYWRAAILLAWDSGLRRGDVWAFRKSDVRPDGTVRVLQRKTQKGVTVRLRQSTIEALNAIHHDQACKWTMEATFFGRHFKKLVKASAVGRGSFKWVRRSSGSYVELQQPGAGGKHLGHRDPRVFTKHYDAQLGGHTLPMPPDLDASA